MTTYEFWRDMQTGMVWAVRLEDGIVNGASGPLDDEEVDETFLESLDYSAAPAMAMDRDRSRYALYEQVRV